MKTIPRPWLKTFYAYPIPPKLSREEFVRQYLPKYVHEYRSPTGVRMVRGASGKLHAQKSTKASWQAQVSKRERRINEAFAAYCSDHGAAEELDSKNSKAIA